MVRLLQLNRNLNTKGLQNPGVDEAERDAVNIGHGVGGQGGQALDDDLSKVGCDDGGHQGDEQTMDDAGDNGAAAAAHRIGKDGCGTTGEEIGHDAGDDHGQTEKGPQEHTNEGANGGEDETVNNGIGCEGEQNRAVKCRTGTGDDLLRNAIEGGNQLGDEQTNTGEQNEQTNAEGDTLEDSEDDVVLPAGGFRYYLGTSQDGKQNIEGNHDGSDCKVGILQEGQLGAELGILGGFGNIAGQLGNTGTENITQSAEVTESDIIAAGDFADEGLCHGGEYDAADTTQDGTDADGETVAEAAEAHAKEDAGHGDVNGGFAIEEDIFELGEAGQNQVYIGTDNMVLNRGGIKQNRIELQYAVVRRYIVNDILLSNIRPYLKKIWFADKNGGCSSDVLVIRAKSDGKVLAGFLYQLLSQDVFFDEVTANAVGTKMPRGDKNIIKAYPLYIPVDLEEQRDILKILAEMQIEIENLEKDLNKYRQIKQGMMSELLTGRIRLL